jgi:hypothetical protein
MEAWQMTIDAVRRRVSGLLTLGGLATLSAGAARADPERASDDLVTCRELTLRASMLMDANDAEGLVALFTPDLEFVKPSTYPEVSIRGREQLRAVIAGRSPQFVSRHVCTNAIADRLGPDSIRVRSYFTHFSGTRPVGATGALPIADALRSVGEYDDTLSRTGEGWRIARRVGRFSFGGL